MNRESLIPHIKLNWKVICHTKTDINRMKWWYNSISKEYWLFVLSEDSNKIFILNALTGKYIKSLGSPGDKVGQFDLPKDILIYENYIFVLEKNNHRIQIFTLPDLKFISFIGEVELTNPTCLESVKLRKDKKNFCCLLVGDNLDNKPSRNKCYFKFIFELNEVNIYDLEIKRNEPKNNSKLGYIESIKYDGLNDNLYIIDKLSKDIKIFNFNDEFKFTIFKNFFKGDPSQIQQINGYTIVGDFSRLENFFHIFDNNFKYINSFVSDFTLKNNCFCIINHNNNNIIYSNDEDRYSIVLHNFMSYI